MAIVLLWRARARYMGSHRPLDRSTKIVLIALAAEVLYIALAGMPIQVGHRLFEPVFSSDWEIRLPSISAAVRDGVPPHNPFFTFRGQSPPMRYYYYWYSLCAQVVRLVRTDSRSTLLASSAFAALGIVATLFLYLKYLLPQESDLRRRCVLLLGLLCVLSLDVIPSLVGLFAWHIHLRPEIEWWSQDRSPGLPAAVLYAPHHIAGSACGLLAFLVASLLTTAQQPVPWRKVLVHGAVIALAVAGLVGTSSFILLFIALALAALGVERLFRRDGRTLAALLFAGVLSLAVSGPFLHELFSKSIAIANTEAGKHSLAFSLRDNKFAISFLYGIAHLVHRGDPGGPFRYFYRALAVASLYTCETGFFMFVLLFQFKRDMLTRRRMSPQARALWILALSIGFFALFVTSAPIQFVNDLGVHAGLMLRLVLTLWGTGVVSWYLAEQRRGRVWLPAQRWAIGIAGAFLVLGVTEFVWQAVVERVYLVLVDRGSVPPSPPFPRSPHLAATYNDIYETEHALDHLLPPDAVIQSDPASRYQTIFRLYQTRRQAAGDLSCEGAFGGDPALCHSYAPGILKLYGGHARYPVEFARYKPETQFMTMAAFSGICAQTGISAMMATRADPAWYFPQSWVWQGLLLYGNGNVRAIRCPAG